VSRNQARGVDSGQWSGQEVSHKKMLTSTWIDSKCLASTKIMPNAQGLQACLEMSIPGRLPGCPRRKRTDLQGAVVANLSTSMPLSTPPDSSRTIVRIHCYPELPALLFAVLPLRRVRIPSLLPTPIVDLLSLSYALMRSSTVSTQRSIARLAGDMALL
jgi:hypothetical protein